MAIGQRESERPRRETSERQLRGLEKEMSVRKFDTGARLCGSHAVFSPSRPEAYSDWLVSREDG